MTGAPRSPVGVKPTDTCRWVVITFVAGSAQILGTSGGTDGAIAVAERDARDRSRPDIEWYRYPEFAIGRAGDEARYVVMPDPCAP